MPLRQTVLLVDDNPDIFSMYQDVLPAMSPFQVFTAADGVEALEALDRCLNSGQGVDCVVVDVKMPHLDGLQLMRALRGDPRSADIPAVILTALAQDKDQFAGLAAGADQYLTKPVSVPDLITVISAAIALSAEQRTTRLRDLAETSSCDG